MNRILLALAIVAALCGKAYGEDCEGVPDEKACLKAKQTELEKQLKEVEARLRGLEKVPVIKRPTVKLSDDFWLTLDVGVDLANGFYPSIGVSMPLGPVYISPGVWFGSRYEALDEPAWGWYLSVGYSWTLIK